MIKIPSKKQNRRKNIIIRSFGLIALACLCFFGIEKVTVGVVQAIAAEIISNQDLSISKETSGKPNISDEIINKSDDWNLILVNPWNKISEKYETELTQLINGHAIDSRAYPNLQKMMDDARTQGLSPIICSSFRTMDKQKSLFTNQINKYVAKGYSMDQAKKEAAKWVAVPGTSEHQTGLAVDIVSLNYQSLDKEQENTPEQKWLMENSYKYGFILRYPEDKSDITGISYEPWHYRYVGVDAAKEIYEREICLEEYLGV